MRKILFLVLWFFSWSWAWASPRCEVIVLINGEEAIASQVKKLLIERGIQTTEEEGCPTLQVTLEKREDGLWLGLVDLSGRVGERRVTEPETAAALIEAWARADLSAPLLLMRQPPASKPAESQPASVPVSSAPASAALSRPASIGLDKKPKKSRGFFSIETEILSAEQSVGAGFLASGGKPISGVVLGGYLRGYASINQNICGSSCVAALPNVGVIQIDTQKNGWDFMASFSSSLYAKRISLSLMIGAGLGWVKPLSAIESIEAKGEREFGPRLDARVEATRAVSERVSWIGSVGFGAAPLGDFDGQIIDNRFQLDTAPQSAVRASFGLRIGAP